MVGSSELRTTLHPRAKKTLKTISKVNASCPPARAEFGPSTPQALERTQAVAPAVSREPAKRPTNALRVTGRPAPGGGGASRIFAATLKPFGFACATACALGSRGEGPSDGAVRSGGWGAVNYGPPTTGRRLLTANCSPPPTARRLLLAAYCPPTTTTGRLKITACYLPPRAGRRVLAAAHC